MSAGNTWVVLENVTGGNINVYSEHSTASPSKIIGRVPAGYEFMEIDSYGNVGDPPLSKWLQFAYSTEYVDKGLVWIQQGYCQNLSTTVNSITTNSSAVSSAETNEYLTLTGEDSGGISYTSEEIAGFAAESSSGTSSSFYKIDSVVGVFGLPYQFLPNTDPRIKTGYSDNIVLGMEYADKIVSNIPILFLMPGRPSFMKKFTDEERATTIKALVAAAGGSGSGYVENLNGLLSNNGRYYVFDGEIEEYYKYVNPMCRIAAQYLGIQDQKIGGGLFRLGNMDWKSYTLNHLTLTHALSDAASYGNLAFYIDSDTSVSEGFGNSTTESSIASSINGISDLTREIHFLTGYASAATDTDWLSKNAEVFQNVENMNDFITRTLGNGNFLSNLGKHLTTVIAGGKLIFPEIWADSSLSRSYSVKFKFVSPDCNRLSIYLNVLVPLFHLLGLVGPQSVTGNPNGYLSPFLVRGIYKSFFNVDMGIITDMSVTKGGDCLWTMDGLPTSIEVDITIKDLYDVMALTASDNLKYDTMDNTAQMDYIANLCGINMYKPELGRQISMLLLNNIENRALDLVRDTWSSVKSGVADACRSIWSISSR